MTLEDVRALDATLRGRGETLSANKLVQHHGGSKREAVRLMRQYRAETPPAPIPVPAPVVQPPPTPVPWLEEAEARVRQTKQAEDTARRLVQVSDSGVTGADVFRAQQEHLQAQSRVNDLERSLASLRARLPGDRIARRRARGNRVAVEDEFRRRLMTVRREDEQAEEALVRTLAGIVAIAGEAAVPHEEA
jgi:hypothetical protein